MSESESAGEAELRALRRAFGETVQIAALYGSTQSGKSALVRQLREGLVTRIALGGRPHRPEYIALRLLQAVDAPRDVLRAALLSAPDGLADWTMTALRDRLRVSAAPVVVLDDLPLGSEGEELLRTLAELLAGTSCVVIATTRTDHVPVHDHPNVVRYPVYPGPPEARHPGLAERRALLSAPAAALLDTLAAWEGTAFPLDTALPVEGLTRPEVRAAIEQLQQHGLLHPLRPGWCELIPGIREQFAQEREDDELRSVSRQLDNALAQSLLDEPEALGDKAEPCVDLALRLVRSGETNSRTFMAWLANQLATEGALIPLLMLKSGLGHTTGEWDALTVPLAAAARQAGQPEAAAEALTGIDTPDALRELAVCLHHMGFLGKAEATLDTLPDVPDGWALHTRAAIRIDRGSLPDVGRLLRLAIETHQVHGDRRGEAWAVFHYGRLRLTRGDLEEARKRLDAAWHTFQDVGDVVGAAWADTELCRVALLQNGPEPDVLRELEAAPSAHREHGDVRGEAWATLLLGVGYADAGHGEAAQTLQRAQRLFQGLPDHLGNAWADHHDVTVDGARPRLVSALAGFIRADCRTGVAWTWLQIPIQSDFAPPPDSELLVRAGKQFAAIGDTAGELWVTAARYGPDAVIGARAIQELARCYPGRVLDGIDWRDPRLRIPHAIRHLIPEPADPLDDTPPAAARIRLTLLDDSPALDATARISLRVDRAPEFPDTPLPPLTVRATPLTRADIDPPHSLRIDGTALFLFTPHATGRHRIRFTVEDAVSRTVLQQVETEIDVTGGADTAPLAAPRPEPARRA